MFRDKPLAAKVQRTSYQDSNIFGYKETNNPTVQGSATKDQKQAKIRNNATFESRVFEEANAIEERPSLRSR